VFDVKIQMKFETADPWNQWNTPLDTPAFSNALVHHGWTITDDKPDLVFHTLSLLKDDEQLHPNTIVFIRRDASWLNLDADQWNTNDNVLGFILPLVASKPDLSESQYVFGGPPSSDVTKPVKSLTAMLWQCLSENPFYAKDTIPKKSLDVMFVGTMHKGGQGYVCGHRSALRKAWYQVSPYSSVGLFNASYGPKYVIGWHQVWEIVKVSKVMVCPWGICEISWRDYEAVLGGCMIIKPEQPEMSVTCNPWKPKNVVYCKHDFSDLDDSIGKAIRLHDERQDLLMDLRKEMLENGSSLDFLAREAAQTFDAFYETVS